MKIEEIEIHRTLLNAAIENEKKRSNTNYIFSALIVGIFVLMNSQEKNISDIIYVTIIILSILWIILLRGYKKISSSKYKIILNFEQRWEFKPITDEWKIIEKDTSYFELTTTELCLPIFFATISIWEMFFK